MEWWLELACRAVFLVVTMWCCGVMRDRHLRAVSLAHMEEQGAGCKEKGEALTPAVEEGVALPGP